MWSPWRTVSSPVLTMAVMSAGGTTSTIPRRSRAAPTPPARAVIIAVRRRRCGEDIGGRLAALTRWSRPVAGDVQGSLRAAGATCTLRPGRLSVGFDATPLLGRPDRGRRLLRRRADRPLRARPPSASRPSPSAGAAATGSPHWCPSGCPTRQRAMPARPLHAAWAPLVGSHRSSGSSATTTWSTGPTSWSRRPGPAARVVTVHDLTVVLYPELCDPPTLGLPGPHPPGGRRRGVDAHAVAVRGRPGGRGVRRRS